MTVIPISAGKTMVGIDLGAACAAIVEDRHPVIIARRPDRIAAGDDVSVLRGLREDAEAYLERPIDEAVIAVPAHLDERRRRAVREAATSAGLRALRLINAPTAAALAYGLHQRRGVVRAAVLAFDAGSFDVTVLEARDGALELQAAASDVRLGGGDFIEALLGILAKRRGLAAALEDATACARLREACAQAERRLAAEDVARVAVLDLEIAGRRQHVDEAITRAEAEDAWSPLLSRLGLPIMRALRDADVQEDAIDEVLLVGGPTRQPCVFALAARLFGRMPLRTLSPDETVALGAAVQAALGEQRVDERVRTALAAATVSIGVGDARTDGRCVPVIERGTALPATRVQTFNTTADDQQRLEIELFLGEQPLCRENRRLGSLLVGDLPARLAGHVLVDVRLTLSADRLEAEAIVRETDQRVRAAFDTTADQIA